MSPSTTTFELIEECRKGDQEAFRLLFEKYRGRLAVFLRYRLGRDRTACLDDLIQETFFRGFRSLESFSYDTPGSFARWLFKIADHAATDMARYEGRQKRSVKQNVRLRSPSNPAGPDPVETHTPSRELRHREELEELLSKLDLLPEQYRAAILLCKVEGLTTRELARQIGKSPEAAALLLHRAVKRFRQLSTGKTE